jgi:thiol-disulfide isomerase/thioredoxin
VLLVILFSYIGYNGYKKYYKQSAEVKDFSDVANSNKRKKEAQVFFFFADWCPHCRKAKPEWEQFKEEYDGKVVNDYTISCQPVDCTDDKDQKTATLIKQYNIESYPTIIMLVGENKIDYDAKVSKSGLEQLVLSGTSK